MEPAGCPRLLKLFPRLEPVVVCLDECEDARRRPREHCRRRSGRVPCV